MPERIQDRLHQIEARINQPEFMKSGGAANEIDTSEEVFFRNCSHHL